MHYDLEEIWESARPEAEIEKAQLKILEKESKKMQRQLNKKKRQMESIKKKDGEKVVR